MAGDRVLHTPVSHRRPSLDVIRGYFIWNSFIMDSVALAVAMLPASWFRDLFTRWFTHAGWNGFHYVDAGFPGYLMLLAASLVYSYERRLQQGWSRRRLFRQLIRRAALLWLFAFFFHGGFSVPLPRIELADIFFELAVGLLISGVLFLALSTRDQIVLLALFLIAHSILLSGVDVPGYGYADFTRDGNVEFYLRGLLSEYVSAHLGLTGEYHAWGKFFAYYAFLPKITGTCLIGLLLGKFLRTPRSFLHQAIMIGAAGCALMAAGTVWGYWIPINKLLWTPSYTLFCAGFIFAILAMVITVTEIIPLPKVVFVFSVFGRHPLLSWASFYILPFDYFAKLLLGKGLPLGLYQNVLLTVLQVVLCWLFILWLQKQFLDPAKSVREAVHA